MHDTDVKHRDVQADMPEVARAICPVEAACGTVFLGLWIGSHLGIERAVDLGVDSLDVRDSAKVLLPQDAKLDGVDRGVGFAVVKIHTKPATNLVCSRFGNRIPHNACHADSPS
eukprot:795401-Amorphochlora_amoeboformis.AAC.1